MLSVDGAVLALAFYLFTPYGILPAAVSSPTR
jgi:hypothetical protein